ncbi:hypothetical protein Tco_1257309, partial [Tanacetum coccineum]
SFVPMEEDLPPEKVQKEESSKKKAEGISKKKSICRKRAKDKQEQESSKRQRVEDDKEEEELKKCFKLAKEEEIEINAIPLATKVPVVVNLWKLVKARHRDNRLEEDFERVLWGDLRVMFEPNVESEVWRSLQGYKIYPLTPITITNMLNKKLQADRWNEMVYQLLKLMVKQQNVPLDLSKVHRWRSSLRFSVIIARNMGMYQGNVRNQNGQRMHLITRRICYCIQEVTLDVVDNSGPIFDTEPLQKDDDDLAIEHDLLASLIDKLKCEIDDRKNCNKFLESSNKALVDKLKAELDRYHDVNYASKMEIDYAKAKGDLVSYKLESQKSFNEYTQKINDFNQTILEMKKELIAHQETISIMSQEKEAQKKFHKTREDKEPEKVISLENKIKILDDIV